MYHSSRFAGRTLSDTIRCMQKRTLIGDVVGKIGEMVTLAGWVDVRRDHGKLIFLDLRDRSGRVQMVALPNHKEVHATAEKVRPEWVLSVTGVVNKRPEKMVNPKEPNGTVELEITAIEVLNEADTPPFDLHSDGREVNEEVRLKYRYLDLRRPRLRQNVILRHLFIKSLRDYLGNEGFVEIETPILTKSTPEGARDYLVPSRLDRGKFYALPQSPQQYKQLLMIAGIERYFQIARCFRDEDTRGDRQPEFTQLDLEMAFVERDEVIDFIEKTLIHLVKTVTPEKHVQEVPFPRFTYKEAMEKYKSDKPDLRKNKDDPNLLAFCWIVDFPFFEKTDEGGWTFTHNPFSSPKPEHMDWLLRGERIPEILTTQYDVALNGFEIGGGSIRNNKPDAIRAVFKVMGYPEGDIQKNFGHMLEAYHYGAPPHGGIAWGLDRIIAILSNEPNIREVIPFAKTGEGRDPMMSSPSEVSAQQLKELGIEVKTPRK